MVRYCPSDQIEEDEMGGARGTQYKCIQDTVGETRRRETACKTYDKLKVEC